MARRGPNSAILVGRDGDIIVATVLVGHDGHRGWVYYVAVDPEHHGKKVYGRVDHERGRRIGYAQLGIEKLMLLVRSDNTKVQAFYEQLGYDEQKRVLYAKWLDGREPTP